MRRALLLSYAFPPIALPEAVLSAKAIGSIRGWTVDVVCAPSFRSWMGDDRSLDAYVRDHFAEVERIAPTQAAKRLPIGRIPLVGSRPDPLRLLNRRTHRVASRRLATHAYDAVISWSTWHSIHLVARRLRRAGGPPWLAHFSDLWSGNPFTPLGGNLQRVNERLERGVLETADRLLYTSTETVDLVAGIFGDQIRPKSLVIPHAFDPDLYPPRRERRSDAPIVARYLGRFYGARTPEPLFAGLGRLIDRDPDAARRLRVEIIGEVGAGMLDTAAARALPAGLVSVVPPVDYVVSLRLAAEADLLLVVDAPAEVSVFLPSKLIDYLGTGRPIVCISPPGAARGLVESIGGHVADPTDADAVAAALSAGLDESASRQPAAVQEIVHTYSVEAVGARMAAMLDEVCATDA